MNSEDLLPGVRGFHTHGGDAWSRGAGSVSARQSAREKLQADIDAFLEKGGEIKHEEIRRYDPANVKRDLTYSIHRKPGPGRKPKSVTKEQKPAIQKKKNTKLTERQNEVLKLLKITNGKLPRCRRKEIAEQIGITRTTLRVHLKYIEQKGHIKADGKDYTIIARDS